MSLHNSTCFHPRPRWRGVQGCMVRTARLAVALTHRGYERSPGRHGVLTLEIIPHHIIVLDRGVCCCPPGHMWPLSQVSVSLIVAASFPGHSLQGAGNNVGVAQQYCYCQVEASKSVLILLQSSAQLIMTILPSFTRQMVQLNADAAERRNVQTVHDKDLWVLVFRSFHLKLVFSEQSGGACTLWALWWQREWDPLSLDILSLLYLIVCDVSYCHGVGAGHWTCPVCACPQPTAVPGLMCRCRLVRRADTGTGAISAWSLVLAWSRPAAVPS